MTSSPTPTLAVLASGQGSNFEALAIAAEQGELGGRIALLLSDHVDAPVLERARRFQIEARHLPGGCYRTRIEDEPLWIDALKSRGIEVVLLAGFMRRLHAHFLDAFADSILNIHPSLLPAFPGCHAIRQAWQHGVRVTGCTVHLVTADVDAGPILAQECIPVPLGIALADLEARVHEVEHRLYPETVRRFLSESWRCEEGRVLFGGSR